MDAENDLDQRAGNRPDHVTQEAVGRHVDREQFLRSSPQMRLRRQQQDLRPGADL